MSRNIDQGDLSHVVVVAGGLGHEREISLRSGTRIANTLRKFGIKVDMIDFDRDLFANLERLSPQVVFPVVHGLLGEGGALQDLLATTGIPYVGTTGTFARVASDKAGAKAVLLNAGLPTPACLTYSRELFQQIGADTILDHLVAAMPFPLVVKPARGGSGLGVHVVSTMSALRDAMVSALAYDEQVVIEQFVSGTDVSVAVFDSRPEDALPASLPVQNCPNSPAAAADNIDAVDAASEDSALPNTPYIQTFPPIEIKHDGDYDYDARYNAGRAEYFIPARLDAAVLGKVADLARQTHKALCLRHLSRIDMVVDGQGQPWIIDVNVLPGMTDTSLWPQAANAAALNGFAESLKQLTSLPLR